MLARFVWFYVKVVLAFVLSLAFAAGTLEWKFGYKALIKTEVLSEAKYLWIGIPTVALITTIGHFLIERRKQ